MRLLFTILSISLLLSTCCFAQSDSLKGILPLRNGEVYYKRSVSTPGLDKAEVFRRARKWWVLNYKSAKDVLQLADDKTGELVGKGYQRVDAPGEKGSMAIDFYIHSVMSLDAKEGGYTLTIDQVRILNSFFAPPTPPLIYKRSPEKNLIRVLKGVDMAIQGVMASINEFIVKGE